VCHLENVLASSLTGREIRMSKDVKFVPRLNADLELKELGKIMGPPIYIDMAHWPTIDDDNKFITYLEVQKMLADFFNMPANGEGRDHG
jgi:hypothetical protein